MTIGLIAVLLGVAFWSAALAASGAPSFRAATQDFPVSSMHAKGALPGCGSIVLSQNSSQSILPGNSSNCNFDGVVHAENSYYRSFDILGFSAGFDVCSIEVGVERAVAGAGAGAQPVIVNVYSGSGAPFPDGALSLVGTQTVNLPDQSASIYSVPVSARVNAGNRLIVEVLTPSGQAAGNSFFMGSNDLGETQSGFIRAPDCGVLDPMTTVDSGFPDMNIVLNVRGDAAVGTPAISLLPDPVDFGGILIGVTEPGSVGIINTGNDVLRIHSIAAPPLPFVLESDECTGQFLAVDGRCDMHYSFSPLGALRFEARLAINSNAAPAQIVLVGTGYFAEPVPFTRQLAILALILLFGAIALHRLGRVRTRRV